MNSMNNALQEIINRSDTWRGAANHFAMHASYANTGRDDGDGGLATGYSALDNELRRGGWPLDGAIELLSDG